MFSLSIKKNRIAGMMMGAATLCAMASPAGAAGYETDVNYTGSVDPGTSAYTITVPASITVDGAAGDVTIEGYTAQAVTLTCPTTVDMTDTVGNVLVADLDMPAVELPISLTASGTVEETVAATWADAPQIGTWTGNFTYEVQ